MNWNYVNTDRKVILVHVMKHMLDISSGEQILKIMPIWLQYQMCLCVTFTKLIQVSTTVLESQNEISYIFNQILDIPVEQFHVCNAYKTKFGKHHFCTVFTVCKKSHHDD
ncbi:hypothetical protein X975_25609, partial [Stegodyphus mimosarum]